MDADLSNVEFNRNQKTDNAAIGVIYAIRILLAALVVNGLFVWALLLTGPDSTASPGLIEAATIALVPLRILGFCCGAYGTYTLAEALGWAGWVSALVILGFVLPQVGWVLLVALIVQGLVVVSKSKYRFSLVGLLKRPAGSSGGA